jgi:hypothetical protein
MINNNFHLDKFIPFEQSTKVDGNYTGRYDKKVVRVIEKDKEDYKSILNFSAELYQLIKSNFSN